MGIKVNGKLVSLISKIISALKEDKREIATIGKEIAERKLTLLKISLTTQTENELIRYFDANTTLNLYFQFGTGSISNSAIKEFVRLKKGGWYQSIKNRIYGQPSFKKEDIKSSKIIVFNESN